MNQKEAGHTPNWMTLKAISVSISTAMSTKHHQSTSMQGKEFEIIIRSNFTQAVIEGWGTIDYVDGQPKHWEDLMEEKNLLY